MTSLTALLIATPLFGFALDLNPELATPPAVVAASDPLTILSIQPIATQLEAPKPTTADLIKRRNKLAKVHKWLGISTWGMMTITTALGFFQYANKYGFFASRENTRCVKGNAILGQKQCRGQPVPHLVTSALTAGLYFTTFGLSFAMPDPLGVSEGNSKFAKRLRTHKVLRWVHFSGMIFQILFGAIIANSDRFGLDRANDYRTLQALATVHLATGLMTYGALTWAGAIMLK